MMKMMPKVLVMLMMLELKIKVQGYLGLCILNFYGNDEDDAKGVGDDDDVKVEDEGAKVTLDYAY